MNLIANYINSIGALKDEFKKEVTAFTVYSIAIGHLAVKIRRNGLHLGPGTR